jgi:hypothetical protein
VDGPGKPYRPRDPEARRSRVRAAVLLPVAAVFALVVGVAAYVGLRRDDGSRVEPASSTSVASPVSAPAYRSHDAKDQIIRISRFGAMRRPTAVGSSPDLVVYGDGTVLERTRSSGPIAEYISSRVSPDAIDRVVSLGVRVVEAGSDFGQSIVMDAGWTRVAITLGDAKIELTAYALDVRPLPTDLPASASDAQRENRQALERLVDAAQALPNGGEPWTPVSIRATVSSPGFQSGSLEWPLKSVDLSGTGGCASIRGGDVRTLLEAMGGSDSLRSWSQNGHAYVLQFAPVLPGEAACPAPGD